MKIDNLELGNLIYFNFIYEKKPVKKYGIVINIARGVNFNVIDIVACEGKIKALESSMHYDII